MSKQIDGSSTHIISLGVYFQVNPGGDRRDWGTGIAQKKFRVGSPTFFSNPNINIPGLMDDMDGFSCSDSEEEDEIERSKKLDIDEIEDVGNVRIEFRGRNLAEAIEDEEQTKNRMATLAKNQQEDQIMVADLPWNLCKHSADNQNKESADHNKNQNKTEVDQYVKTWMTVEVNEVFNRDKHDYKCPETWPTTDFGISTMMKLPRLDILQTREILREGLMTGVLPRESDGEKTFSFDLQPNLKETAGPSPSLLLQALTMSNSNDVINLGEPLIFFICVNKTLLS